MSESLINDATMTGIANAIRSKNGLTATYTPSGMIDAINSLVTTSPNLQNKSVSPSATTVTVTADTGYTGLGKVTVNAAPLESKTFTPTTTLRTLTPGSGYYGMSQVIVDAIPSQYIIPSDTIPITANGTYNVTNYASASVNIPTPSGTYTITANGTYDVTNYATASVSVSGGGGITPTGTITITNNGTVNVTNYASANVNVHDFNQYIDIDISGGTGTCSETYQDMDTWIYHQDKLYVTLDTASATHATTNIIEDSSQGSVVCVFYVSDYDTTTGGFTMQQAFIDDHDLVTGATLTVANANADNIAY